MKIRLLAAIQHEGHMYQRGDILDWPDNLKPPMRHVSQKHDHIDYRNNNDALHVQGAGVDEPLYEEIKEEKKNG